MRPIDPSLFQNCSQWDCDTFLRASACLGCTKLKWVRDLGVCFSRPRPVDPPYIVRLKAYNAYNLNFERKIFKSLLFQAYDTSQKIISLLFFIFIQVVVEHRLSYDTLHNFIYDYINSFDIIV